MILETIQSPDDVKKLNAGQIRELCGEIRSFLIENVSKTGGHLASNLGVVELTVAIHRVFNTERDRLVFDVGHQCYVHKLLTGRREQFASLRQHGGISGFPKPKESPHDAFVAGHASNSVSVALGMARARTMQNDDYSVLALIGDGALTGGLSYEGLNNAGASGEKLIVILNDNEMSISRNVGAMSKHLSVLRTKPGYYTFKKLYRGVLSHGKLGKGIHRFNHKVKTAFKHLVMAREATLFEDMGFSYFGPVDGHNVEKLEHTLRWAKESDGPVLIHVKTVKGKGYTYAEKEPNLYHGVSPFDPAIGLQKTEKESFSSVFGKTMCALAKEEPKLCAITAAMEEGTGLEDFASAYPDRFFDVGIAEGHAGTMAAGLASQGAIPVFAVYSTFLQRAYDSLIHDVALSDLHVIFAVDRAGLVGADGETHHGIFDATFLSDIPNFTVLCPSNFAELQTMLRKVVEEMRGPVAIRYPRGGEGGYRAVSGEENIVCLRDGTDVTLCAYGTMVNQVLEAAELLDQRGISARVLKVNCISPLFDRDLREKIGKTNVLVVAEECASVGCVGQRMAAILAANGMAPGHLVLCNLGRQFPAQGTVDELRKEYGLDAASLADAAAEVLKQ